ncbi:DNA-methyltransferase [Paraburkholderia youngii]|uniref:DNA-methyltransferase n=1 Tax=Paraburkholderia youngii TaxID=2782701 RepID=UPI0015920F14|nr:site-specific DNA-methyltransferase [Paraburkholderia youngii]NUX55944.1 site-specific DNA-methyltransferase [Paraburkholderia youngii]
MIPIQIGDATLYCGDALGVLPQLTDVDAILTDPPYSSGGQHMSDRQADTRTKYVTSRSGNKLLADFMGDNRDQRAFYFWSTLWVGAALRAAKPGSVLCVFSDWRQLPISTDYLQAGGWVWRGIVPWVKTQARPQLGRFTAQCEYVVWGSSGHLPLDRGVGVLPGFYEYASPQQREHITQKPLGLMADLLAVAPPNSLVLDPFMGSGTTGVAAVQKGHRFIGIEWSPVIFDIACRRLEREQQNLFDAPKAAEQPGLFGEGA